MLKASKNKEIPPPIPPRTKGPPPIPPRAKGLTTRGTKQLKVSKCYHYSVLMLYVCAVASIHVFQGSKYHMLDFAMNNFFSCAFQWFVLKN